MLSEIDAVILCGGLGKRLRSVESEKPKVMVEVAQKPFLDLVIEEYKKQGVHRVILCTGYKADDVEEYYRKNSMGLTIEFSREKEPLGTGGAIKNARNLIKSNPFFVQNGDAFCRVDFKKLVQYHNDKKSITTLVVAQAQDSQDFGTIILDESNRIKNFLEKTGQPSNHLNAGIYCFDQKVFSKMPDKANFSMEYDVFSGLTKENFFGFVIEEKFWDIGTPDRYDAVKEIFKGKNK